MTFLRKGVKPYLNTNINTTRGEWKLISINHVYKYSARPPGHTPIFICRGNDWHRSLLNCRCAGHRLIRNQWVVIPLSLSDRFLLQWKDGRSFLLWEFRNRLVWRQLQTLWTCSGVLQHCKIYFSILQHLCQYFIQETFSLQSHMIVLVFFLFQEEINV